MRDKKPTESPQHVPDPPDFNEGGREYRRNLLLSTSVSVVLLLSSIMEPEVLGVKVPDYVMWGLLGISHLYFFVMWRLTAVVEDDMAKRFWNFQGLWKQAVAGGRRNSPGKARAQLFFIRSLPIWAFLVGFFCILYGLFLSAS